LEFLFNKSPYKEFDTKFTFKQEILKIHDELSRTTHTRGSDQHILELRHAPPKDLKVGDLVRIEVRSRPAVYSEELFDKWYYYLCKTSTFVNISLILKYPHILKKLPVCTTILNKKTLSQLKEVLSSYVDNIPPDNR
jgi:hypothetical protein